MAKNILIVTTFNNHFAFFARMVKSLQELGYSVIFLTNKFSIVKEAREKGLTVYGIKSKNSKTDYDASRTLEVVSNKLKQSKSKQILGSVYSAIEQLNSKYKFELIFAWSGVRIVEFAATYYAKSNNIEILFFELGNFPGKIFVDPLGTNANSLLAKDKDILLDSEIDEESFEKWKNDFIEKSLVSHKVPQSSTVASIDVKKNLLDSFGFRILGYSQNESLLTYSKLLNKFFRRFRRLKFDDIILSDVRYAFYPMQVSDDAQLLLNSEIDNIKALEIASEEAERNELILLVKPHPAEVRFTFIKQVEKLKEKLNFHFIEGNTIEILQKAEKVYTINSTVGLQAMLLGKNVKCFGKAFYKDFKMKHLQSYIQNYLMNINFWGEKVIDFNTTQKVLERAKLIKI